MYNAADNIQDYLAFGEYGGVNPSIEDSSTFTFLTSEKMGEIFDHEIEGCYLYSRHMNPTNKYLGDALSLLEGTEDAQVTGSGMAAISCAIFGICSMGDEIVSSHTVYGGTYALMKNFLPKFGIKTNFVDITNLDKVKSKITEKTKIIYCETLSNPMLEVADLPELRKICDEKGIILMVDNTFTPMIISPLKLGADVVIHSLTKYINGASDGVGGVICGSHSFVSSLRDVNSGSTMLLGPTMDSVRSSSILKNLRTLHVRMHQHSKNAMFIATEFEKLGIKTIYPGLTSHPQHELMKTFLNEGYGFSGMVSIDVGTDEIANKLLPLMQNNKIGYFAVSLGFYKTLFSAPSKSTSSELDEEMMKEIGMSGSLIRFSFGLDNNIQRTLERLKDCFVEVGLLK